VTSRPLLIGAICVVAALGGVAANAARNLAPTPAASQDARAALLQAQSAWEEARNRSTDLEEQAQLAVDEAERAARDAAALAAQIQSAEAGIGVAEARIEVLEQQGRALERELAREQQPLVRLTGAMQLLARRPMALAVARPGSVEDLVHLRAIMDSARPVFEQRTAGLRERIAERRAVRAGVEQAIVTLREQEEALTARRAELADLETRKRQLARQRGETARIEGERALVLGEEARDLDMLVGELDRAGALRQRLAAFPGPRLRPADPSAARVTAAQPVAAQPRDGAAPSPYLLPVTGRIITGFGAPLQAGVSRGLTIAPRAGAQVVAPAAGRVAFAGPYRGYGEIVIVEHDGGWTSLVTGLSRISAEVGDSVIAGTPLGQAGPGSPQVTLELRREGEPVNPLDHTR